MSATDPITESVEPIHGAGPASPDVSSIIDTLISEAPAVQEHAIAESQRQTTANALKDKKGVLFNEAIHAKDAQGKPLRAASGEWAKRRGRKAGGTNGTMAGSAVGSSVAPVGSPIHQARTTGEGAAMMFVTICRTVGGEEWSPMMNEKLGVNELANLQKVFGDYFVAKGYKDVPPGAALAIGVMGYMVPRFFMPQTKSRVQNVKEWIYARVGKFKARKGTDAAAKSDVK